MKKIIIMMILLLVCINILYQNIGMYNGINKGIYVDIGNTSYGYEIVGDPGFFTCTIEGGDFTC